jgi:hypothetical protein
VHARYKNQIFYTESSKSLVAISYTECPTVNLWLILTEKCAINMGKNVNRYVVMMDGKGGNSKKGAD